MPENLSSAPPEKVAIVIVSTLPAGHAANVASCIAAGLAASWTGWAGSALADANGLQTFASSHLPISVLGASPDAMDALLKEAAIAQGPETFNLCLFPAYAHRVHDFAEYRSCHVSARHVDEAMLAIGFAGRKRCVNRMTGSLPLWR